MSEPKLIELVAQKDRYYGLPGEKPKYIESGETFTYLGLEDELPKYTELVGKTKPTKKVDPTVSMPNDGLILEAVKSLNAREPSNWTVTGLVRLDTLASKMGIENDVVKRKDVERAAPNYDRTDAAKIQGVEL